MQGIIIKNISNKYTVIAEENKYICEARGKFRHTKDTPLVGDKVEFDEKTNIIKEILPRINKFDRPPVANIYAAIIVASLKKPDLDLYLLDKMLTTINNKCLKVIIMFTKIDLCNKEETNQAKNLKKYYESLNYTVYFNNDAKAISTIKKELRNKVVTLVGQSGAGKSTFLNKLSPSLNIDTHPISEALNRGVHTTRHTEIYDIEGIYFVDTPGFSALELNMTQEELKASFPEFNNYLNKCKYKDCNHDKEDDCIIKQMVNVGKILESRYNNYLSFKKEIYESSRKLFR